MNQYNVIGNLGKDPELRYTQGGTPVCNFSVATKAGFGDNESTTWVRCVAWGKQAEAIEKYFSKGSRIRVSGEIKTGEYEKDGAVHRTWECVVREFGFIDRKADSVGGSASNSSDGFDQSFDNGDIPF